MSHIPTATSLVLALAFAVPAAAQQVLIMPNSSTDTLAAFSPFDGSLVDADLFPITASTSVSAIEVLGEIWISEQTNDRVVRYDAFGNVLGQIGPTFAGGGLDNIRGMAFVNGIVYVTNDGTGNGATADSLVAFDSAGNHLATVALSDTVSPFSVMPFQGDLLVATGLTAGSAHDIHRYTTLGVSVGLFHDSATVSFAHQIAPSSDGNVWCAGFSTTGGGTAGIHKIDAATGAILLTIPGSGPRGVFELLNGNVMWTNSAGAWVYDVTTQVSTLVHPGGSYHLNLYNLTVASNLNYGLGCHNHFQQNADFFEFFPSVPDAKAALDGNALQFSLTPNGYVATWLPGVAGALYTAPTAGATIVANASTTTETFTPSAAIPVPGGVATQWTVSTEGILTAGPVGNEGTDTTPSLTEPATEAGLAFYTWCTQNPAESGSGKIKWEEISGVLYVTFDGVEFSGGTPTVAPSTYQWQINMATGDVLMLWPSFSASNSTSDVLVGCTLAGTGEPIISRTLSTATPFLLAPDDVLHPMALSAAPAPVISPSTLVTYTATDVPEFAPGSGVYIGTMFLSVNPLPSGFDLAGILTTVPGCNAYIATLDIDLGGALSLTPTLQWSFNFSNAFFAPGDSIGCQAVALFDPAFPLVNGESGGFLMSNGVLSTTRLQ